MLEGLIRNSKERRVINLDKKVFLSVLVTISLAVGMIVVFEATIADANSKVAGELQDFCAEHGYEDIEMINNIIDADEAYCIEFDDGYKYRKRVYCDRDTDKFYFLAELPR